MSVKFHKVTPNETSLNSIYFFLKILSFCCPILVSLVNLFSEIVVVIHFFGLDVKSVLCKGLVFDELVLYPLIRLKKKHYTLLFVDS